MSRPRKITPELDTQARRIMQGVKLGMKREDDPAAELVKTAIRFRHFGKADGSEGFSHTSMGAKFRRYGRR